MIQHVYERARQARLVDAVIVATDDQRIMAAVEACGGRAVLTSPTHPTGTDRIAGWRQLTCDIVVNVRAMSPYAPQAIDALVQPLFDDPSIPMSTLAPLRDVAELLTPNVNKVVVDHAGYASISRRLPFL
jgi:3-deoxy-manno-octulosonate cytidylyltransferase (CMP-KDO synthetase)